MIESSGLLSASDFMNYDYCPRIIYFTYTLKRPQTKGAKQEKGLEKDREFKKTERTKITIIADEIIRNAKISKKRILNS